MEVHAVVEELVMVYAKMKRFAALNVSCAVAPLYDTVMVFI